MFVETEEQDESMSLNNNEIEENYSSSEDHVPLDGTPGQRARTFSSSGGGSSSNDGSLDDYFAAIEELGEHNDNGNGNVNDNNYYYYKQQLPQPRPEPFDHLPVEQNHIYHHHHQELQPRRDAAPVRPTRRTRSTQSVSFDRSVTRSSSVDHNRSNSTIMEEDRDYSDHRSTSSSRSLSKQKRSMEIRMDGRVIQLTHSNDGKNVTTLRSTSSVTSSQAPPAVKTNHSVYSASTSTLRSLSWADSDEGNDEGNDDNDDDHDKQQEPSLAGTQDSIKSSIARSAGDTSDDYTDYSKSTAQNTHSKLLRKKERDQGETILEENEAASLDGSDISSTTGVFELAFRFKNLFNMHRISVLIIKWMPCFLLCCFRNNNELQGGASSDRFILARLNIISFFFAAIQLVASLWLFVVLFVKGEISNQGEFQTEMHFWNNNGCILFIGGLALALVFTCFWTTRIVKEVDLVGALRFLWLLLWILPLEAFLNIAAFDYHQVTNIWISKEKIKSLLKPRKFPSCLKLTICSVVHLFVRGNVEHYWNSEQLWWFRNYFCVSGTSGSLCMVSQSVSPIEFLVDTV